MATIQATAPPVPPAPMLATRATVPTGEGWHYEAKWDGARGLIRGFDGHAEIYSRTGTHLQPIVPRTV